MISKIIKLLNKNKIFHIFRTDEYLLWESFEKNLDYLPLDYKSSVIDYHFEYYKGNKFNISDLSFIILSNSLPVAILPLFCIKNDQDSIKFFSNNLTSIVPPIFSDKCLSSIEKNISKSLIKFFIDLKNEYLIELNFSTSYQRKNLKIFNFLLFKFSTSNFITYDLFVDLEKNIKFIKNNLRKSYKSLVINKHKNLDILILDSDNKKIWNEYKKIHFISAGRKTRSDKSWDMQYNEIKKKNAFLVYILYKKKFISGALINFTKDESYYSSGTYLYPNKIINNLGHLTQFRAIEELQKRGIKMHKIGFINYNRDEKRKTIDDFQIGFSTNYLERFNFKF